MQYNSTVSPPNGGHRACAVFRGQRFLVSQGPMGTLISAPMFQCQPLRQELSAPCPKRKLRGLHHEVAPPIHTCSGFAR
jgi:hypothetical protein